MVGSTGGGWACELTTSGEKERRLGMGMGMGRGSVGGVCTACISYSKHDKHSRY